MSNSPPPQENHLPGIWFQQALWHLQTLTQTHMLWTLPPKKQTWNPSRYEALAHANQCLESWDTLAAAPKNWPVTSWGFGTSNGSSFSSEVHWKYMISGSGAPATSLVYQYQASTVEKWDSGDSPGHFLCNSSNSPVNVMRRLIFNKTGISCDLELDLTPTKCIHILFFYSMPMP